MSDSNGRVPAWLAALGVKEGEYFVDAKPRWKRAMKARCFCPAARLYAFLGLHTMGFQQELAVKMEAGKRVPVTPSDAAGATGLLRQNIRRHMEELREWGLAELKGSTKGRQEMYAWASPRPVTDAVKKGEEKAHCNRARLQSLGAPDWLLPLLSHFKIKVPDNFVITRDYISAVEAAARDYQNARIVLARALDCNRATECIYKEERNERNIERNLPSSSAVEVTTSEPEKAEEEESRVLYEQLKTGYPKDHFDEPNTKPSFDGLKLEQKRAVLERLTLYLNCERWRDEDGRWIPLSSNWIKTCDADPPPVIRKKAAATASGPSKFAEECALAQRAREKFHSRGGKRNA